MNIPAKNNPCSCDSGKKYKRCCGKERPKDFFLDLLDFGFEKKGSLISFIDSLSNIEKTDFISKIENNRPALYSHIRHLIDETVIFINLFDKVFIMGGIASIFYNQNFNNNNDDGATEIVLEYCQSICMAGSNINEGKLPNTITLQRIHSALLKIKEFTFIYYKFEDNSRYTQIESEVRKKLISETLQIRGKAYSVHIKALFLDMFSLHDDFFIKKFGFKSSDIIDTFEKVEYEFISKVSQPDGMLTQNQCNRFADWLKTNENKIIEQQISPSKFQKEFLKENPIYQLNSIGDYDKLYRIDFNVLKGEQIKVIESISLCFGQNDKFPLPNKPEYSYEPMNDSDIFSKPFVKNGNDYYVYSNHLLERNLFEIAIQLIKEDALYYKNNFDDNNLVVSKNNFIERQTLDLFKKMLPSVNFFPTAQYNYTEQDLNLKCAKNGRTELDIIGIGNNTTYLIEVKAGLVGNDAKRGGIKSIKSDLKNIIGDAICQSYRAHRYILNSDEPIFRSNDTIINIDKNSKVFRICVSFSYVGNIISALTKLKEFQVIENDADFAWVLNIFNLYVFSEFIDSENMFIDYLEKRYDLYKDKRVNDLDEIAVLGLYFYNNMVIDKIHSNAYKVILNPHYTLEFDNYYQRGGIKPKKVK